MLFTPHDWPMNEQHGRNVLFPKLLLHDLLKSLSIQNLPSIELQLRYGCHGKRIQSIEPFTYHQRASHVI